MNRTRSADRTRSLVLDLIRESDGISRVELSERSGLTEASISTIVRRLIADELVVETGFRTSTGGKRRVLLDINPAARSGVGVSLAREAITIVVADMSGRPVVTRHLDGTGDDEPGVIVARIAEEIHAVLGDSEVAPAGVVGVGVAGPGPLDAATGVLRGRQPGPLWRDFPLEERLETLTGLRVVLDNDATCAALGEYWSNRRGRTPVTATVYMADGIGCGILVDGRVFHGSSSNAGEIGHISLDADGPACHCGSRGCVEVYASPAAVSARALEDADLAADLSLDSDPSAARDNVERMSRAAAAGDPRALDLLRDAAGYLARGVVTLSNILDLDEVNLAGPGFAPVQEIYAEVIREQLEAGTFMRSVHPVTVRISQLGTETAALGAAALILQEQVTPHTAAAARRAREPRLS